MEVLGRRDECTIDAASVPMSNPCCINTTPWVQTQFLGASVTIFSSSFGWGSTTGECSIQLVEWQPIIWVCCRCFQCWRKAARRPSSF